MFARELPTGSLVKSLCWHVSGTSRAGGGGGSPSVCRAGKGLTIARWRRDPVRARAPGIVRKGTVEAEGSWESTGRASADRAENRTRKAPDHGREPRRKVTAGSLGIRQVNGALPPLSGAARASCTVRPGGGGTDAAIDDGEAFRDGFGIGGRRWLNAFRRQVKIEFGGGRVLRHPGWSGRRAGREALSLVRVVSASQVGALDGLWHTGRRPDDRVSRNGTDRWDLPGSTDWRGFAGSENSGGGDHRKDSGDHGKYPSSRDR